MEAFSLILFSVILIIIGWMFGDSTSERNFTNANRVAKAILIAFGTFTVVGASTFIGVTQFTYIVGAYAIVLGLGAAVGAVALGNCSDRVYSNGIENDFDTLPDAVAYGYGKFSGTLVTLISILGLFALLVIQISVGGIILSSLMGAPLIAAIILMASVVGLYVYFGGLKGIFITDLIQGIAMFALFGAIIALMIYNGVPMPDGQAMFPEIFNENWEMSLGFIIVLFVSGFLSISGGADIWLRLYSANNQTSAKRGFYISGFMFLFFMACLTVFGMGVLAALPDAPPGEAFMLYIQTSLPAWIMPVVVIGIFAASISTADVETHVIGTMVNAELKRRNIIKATDEPQKLRIARYLTIGTLAVAALAAVWAGGALGQIYSMFLNILMISGVAAWAVLLKRGRGLLMVLGILASSAIFIWLVWTDRMFIGMWSLLVPLPLALLTLPFPMRR